MKVFGQLEYAQMQNVAGAAASLTPVGLLWWNTVAVKPYVSDGTNARELYMNYAGNSLTSPVIVTPTIDDYLLINEEAAPSTPASGKVAVYAKTDKKLYTKDSAGTETQVGAGGSGELNLIDNPSDANNWSSTGWSSAAATTTTAGDLPLAGIIDTAIKITSDTSAGTEAAEYVSYSFTTPASLASKLKVEFYMRPGTNFIASEWTVSVYAGSTRQSLSTDSSSATYLPNASGKFTTTFDCAAATAYTLRFARPVNAGGNAGVLNVANVIVGPGIQPQGAVATEWQTVTMTGLLTSNVTYAAKERRIGDTAEYDVSITFSNTNTESGSVYLNLPSGRTIDSTKIAAYVTSGPGMLNGHVSVADASGNGYNGAPGFVSVRSSTSVYALMTLESGTYTTSTAINANSNVPITFANGDVIRVKFSVPIAEWAGSGTVNIAQNDVQYYYGTGGTWGTSATITTAQGQGGVLGGTTTPAGTGFNWTIVPATPIPVGARPVLEVSPNGTNWSPVPSNQPSTAIEALRYDGTNYIGATAGVSSAGNLVFTGGKYANGATVAWAGTWYWRIKVEMPGQAIGFGAASSTSSGLLNYYQQDDTTLAAVTFQGNLGGSASAGVAVRITRIGRVVFVEVPTMTNITPTTSSTSLIANTALPTWARPGVIQSQTTTVFNNGAAVTTTLGLVSITTAGIITCFRDTSGTAFTNSATAGWSRVAFSYTV